MAITTQGFSTFSADAVTYIAEKTLMIAKKNVIFQQLGDKAQLPSNNSKTFQYTRYDRLVLPQSALTEGSTPDNTSISISTVSAVADQWGAYVVISDVVDLTIKHPVMQKAVDLMGYQAAETVDREIINVLLAGTQVYYAGGVASRRLITTNLVTSDIRTGIATLRSLGAHEYDGSDYMAVMDPYVEMDLSADTTFQLAASYSNIKVLQNGEVGRWMGARWMRSNLIPVVVGYAQSTFSSNATVGTFTGANYRATVARYDINTGFLVGLELNTAVAMTNTQSLRVTVPSSALFTYKVFVGLAAGAQDDIMYQGSDATLGLAALPASTVVTISTPPVAGTSISGSDIPVATKKVHFSWVIGKEAFTVIDLQKLQTFITPNQASDSDPLVQRRKAGWKLMFKSVINNQNFIARLESYSAFG